MKNAWRPFEWGPRACIGQSLALTELKIVLVTICRALDFTPGYEEWDRVQKTTGLQRYRGERAYQIEEAAAHPAEHYPCRVALSEAGKIISHEPSGERLGDEDLDALFPKIVAKIEPAED